VISITFQPERRIPPIKANVSFDGLILSPGQNFLTEADFTKLKAHPDFLKHLKWGAITVEEEDYHPVEEQPKPEVRRRTRKAEGEE